jgi:hypothetical protein
MTHKGLSIQGALNLAGVYIKDMFDLFVAIEGGLLGARVSAPPQANHSRSSSLYSQAWNWFPFLRASTAPSDPPLMLETPQSEGDYASLGDVPSYVQALRDCVIGTINWAYETELYLGKKGEEIRTFGWVFLNQNLRTDDEEVEQ